MDPRAHADSSFSRSSGLMNLVPMGVLSLRPQSFRMMPEAWKHAVSSSERPRCQDALHNARTLSANRLNDWDLSSLVVVVNFEAMEPALKDWLYRDPRPS